MPSDFDVRGALAEVVDSGASDLHVKLGSPPLMRLRGELVALPGAPAVTQEDTEHALDDLLEGQAKRDDFARNSEVDFSVSLPDVARFRINAFRQRGSISLACRVVPFGVKTVADLGLPPVLLELAMEARGIILVTGATGSGKSTTMAALVDHINESSARHIVTIEDPIEFLHRDKRSVINQREVGLDTGSFSSALRSVLRQDPDVILIGEMRDEETVRAALSAAETGHLVLSTLHTNDATETVNRVIDFFPTGHQSQARAMLAGTLRGIVSQRLLPRADAEGGRVAVLEILRATGRVRDLIMDEATTGRLPEVIADGEFYGMQTFDQALLGHLQAGRITLDDALTIASNPGDFRLLVANGRSGGTSLEDVVVAEPAVGGPTSLGAPSLA